MKKIVQYGIIFGLVAVLIASPMFFANQATSFLGDTRRFSGGSFSGSCSVTGEGQVSGSLNANARSPVVLVPFTTTQVEAIISYSIPAGNLAGHHVTCDLSAFLSGSPGHADVLISENDPNTGSFSVRQSVSGVTTTLNLHLSGSMKANGNEITSCDSMGSPRIIKTGEGIVQYIIQWLLNLLGFDVCFAEGTQILMADGSYKNIEDIAIGDEVISYDLNTETVTVSTVTEVLMHNPSEMMEYYIKINDNIRVTPNHFLYVNNMLMPAELVAVGDIVTKIDGSEMTIESVERIYEQITTYNFHIDHETNLFVAEELLSFPLKINAVATASSSGISVIHLDGIASSQSTYQSQSNYLYTRTR